MPAMTGQRFRFAGGQIVWEITSVITSTVYFRDADAVTALRAGRQMALSTWKAHLAERKIALVTEIGAHR